MAVAQFRSARYAGFQGFDDGYFRNKRIMSFDDIVCQVTYDREFARGRKQREGLEVRVRQARAPRA